MKRSGAYFGPNLAVFCFWDPGRGGGGRAGCAPLWIRHWLVKMQKSKIASKSAKNQEGTAYLYVLMQN